MSEYNSYQDVYDDKGSLDVSVMFEGKVGVICDDEEQALHLISVLAVEHPGVVTDSFKFPYTGFGGKNVGYDVYEGNLMRGSVDYYKDHKVQMIDFAELAPTPEEDICESDINILDFLKISEEM